VLQPGLTALIDVLSRAQAQRHDVDPSIPPIRVDVTGTGRQVTTGAGLGVPVTMHPRDLPAADVVVVPALGTMTAEDTLSALAAPGNRAIIGALGGLDPAAVTIAAACTGVFTLAQSGLLDRRRPRRPGGSAARSEPGTRPRSSTPTRWWPPTPAW
jgi:transcriptional regulator GlxA family with amidase domain